jgi:hypothetical protein
MTDFLWSHDFLKNIHTITAREAGRLEDIEDAEHAGFVVSYWDGNILLQVA